MAVEGLLGPADHSIRGGGIRCCQRKRGKLAKEKKKVGRSVWIDRDLNVGKKAEF